MRRSFEEVVRLRQAELADRLVEIDAEAAIKNLMPLAENYLASDVFARVEAARKTSDGRTARPIGEAGLWSELSFRLRRPLGVLSGAIDKLLITPTPDGRGFEIEIIDFKTNRFQKPPDRLPAVATLGAPAETAPRIARAIASNPGPQIAFDFSTPRTQTIPEPVSLDESLRIAAQDYQLQNASLCAGRARADSEFE